MTTTDSMIVTINLLLYGTAFILGFIVGRITIKSSTELMVDAKGSFFKPEVRQRKQVEIDEKKFVTAISTDDLQKKGTNLGLQTIVEDDVGASVSKLAMLKKK